jgi:hypothetical protein
MIARAAWGRAWVRFGDGSVRVVTLLEEPEEGKELVAVRLEGSWIARKVSRPTDSDAAGREVLYEVWVEAGPTRA